MLVWFVPAFLGPLIRLLKCGSFAAASKSYPQRAQYMKESTAQTDGSRPRQGLGDTCADTTFDYDRIFDYTRKKPDLKRGSLVCCPHRCYSLKGRVNPHMMKRLPQIDTYREVNVDFIEMAGIRYAPQGQRDR